MGERCVLVFTKPAVPGRVKTRLIGHLSAAQAAALHRAMVEDLVAALRGGRFSLRLVWALRAGEQVPGDWLRGDIESRVQRGRDLGERMLHALVEAGREFSQVAVVGSDHPGLGSERVEAAFHRLEEGADVVVGPAEDGGYYLLAMRSECVSAALFDAIEWSSEQVLAQTLERCRKQSLGVSLLDVERDVDTADDLRRLRRSLARGLVKAPRVEALLAALGPLREAS